MANINLSFFSNQEYLQYLEVTKLGHIINILKHAKEAKNKQESDVFMVDEVKEFPPVITSSDQPEKEAEKNLVLTNVFEVTVK